MIQNVLLSFKSDIKELKNHLHYIESISTKISSQDTLYSYINSPVNKKFNYTTIIISLYGIIELYSEIFLMKYLENLNNQIPQYIKIKEKIRDVNFYNTASLTLKVLDKKHQKYNHIKPDVLIENLNSCIGNNSKYIINYPSFTLLSGNLKHEKIRDLYKQIDINIDSDFDKYTNFGKLKSGNKFQKIDDIVDRRNEIAHGSLTTLLDPSEFPDYIDFVDEYFSSLSEILEGDLEQETLRFQLEHQSVLIENVTLCGGKIIGFDNNKNITIQAQDFIIVQKPDGHLIKTKIVDIKTYPTNSNITLKLDIKNALKSNQNFYLIK